MDILDLKPSKQVKHVLSVLTEAYMENPNITKEEVISLITKINLIE